MATRHFQFKKSKINQKKRTSVVWPHDIFYFKKKQSILIKRKIQSKKDNNNAKQYINFNKEQTQNRQLDANM